MAEMLFASGGVLGAGILALRWARACRRGTLPRNWILGYRTPLTLRDKTAWEAVNRASAPFILIAGSGLILAGIAGAVLALTHTTDIVPVVVGSSIVWLIAWILIGLVPAVRAERAYRQRLMEG